MSEIIMELKNKEEGAVTLTDSGDILIEGKYYVLKNNVLLNGNSDIKIPKGDVLRIGTRKISSSKKLIGGVFMFGLAGCIKAIQSTIQSPLDKVSSEASNISGQIGYAQDVMEYLTDNTYSGVSDTASAIKDGASTVSEISGQIGTVLNIAAIILFVLSIIMLVKYLVDTKKYVEINTEYGSFCISKRGIAESTIDELIKNYYKK